MLTNQYRVPKRRIPACVSMRDLCEERLNLFVGNHAESHCGRERPSDLLEGPNAFLAAENERGDIEVLRKGAISTVSVSASLEQEEDPIDSVYAEGTGDTLIPLTVTLDDGQQIEGIARYQLPEGRRRLQDYLNQEGSFLRLFREEEVLFINKNCIAHVRESKRPVNTAE